MHDKSNKKRLYWLLDEYLSGRISTKMFCDEFYYSYDLGIDKEILTDLEKKVFLKLSQVAARFTEYDEDHKLDPNAFSSLKELKESVLEAKNMLGMGNSGIPFS